MRALAVLLLTACATTATQAQTREQPLPDLHVPPFYVTNLLRVGANGVVAIGAASAQAQVRTDGGEWLPAVKLPFEQVSDATSRDSSVLIAGYNSGDAYAVLFDPQLKSRGRWKLEDSLYVDLSASGPRQVNTKFMRELLPEGVLGPAKPLSDSTDPRKRMGRPTLLETASTTIVCLPRDQRMSVDAPGTCARVTPPAWNVSGRFENPFLCGAWLITLEERPKTFEARAYAISTGRVVASHSFPEAPTLACVDNKQVLAARSTFTLFDLPNFKRVWSAPIATKAPKPQAMVVPNVVVTSKGVMYRVQGTNEIATLPLPW